MRCRKGVKERREKRGERPNGEDEREREDEVKVAQVRYKDKRGKSGEHVNWRSLFANKEAS